MARADILRDHPTRTTVTRRLIIIAAAAALVLAACGGTDLGSDTTTTDATTSDSGDTTGTTIDNTPSDANYAAFLGVPPPTTAIYTNESGTDTSPCREYESTETPYNIVTSHTEDLQALGWTVENLLRSGYQHENAASFGATKDGRALTARATGSGPTSSIYTLCITSI